MIPSSSSARLLHPGSACPAPALPPAQCPVTVRLRQLRRLLSDSAPLLWQNLRGGGRKETKERGEEGYNARRGGTGGGGATPGGRRREDREEDGECGEARGGGVGEDHKESGREGRARRVVA